jgi:hypothetical protein
MINKKHMENSMKRFLSVASLLLLLMSFGCTKHEVETKSQIEVAPVEVKPIHITIDINIKVDRALDDFFSDLDETAEEIK